MPDFPDCSRSSLISDYFDCTCFSCLSKLVLAQTLAWLDISGWAFIRGIWENAISTEIACTGPYDVSSQSFRLLKRSSGTFPTGLKSGPGAC